jgi:YebC/PmpR family DNA-binding regulatory protein
MGRHATVAGRMAASAAARGKLFTKLAREIMVAARNGSDPEMNATLRMAIEKARQNNLPKDNIERAIKKGAGELEAESYEEVVYEGYGPGGTAVLVECLTDNRNRTAPEMRRLFTKGGGNMGEMGSVAWMFKRKSVFVLGPGVAEEAAMEVALDAGAEDIAAEEGEVVVYADASQFAQVRDALQSAQFEIVKSGIEMIPDTTIALDGEDAQKFLDLIHKLEDHDDAQNVFHNCDISAASMQAFLQSQGS